MSSRQELNALVDDFFNAASRTHVTTHQEWLLRHASQLMQREIDVVRMMEADVASAAPPRRKWTRTSSTNLVDCTKACTATETKSSGAS